MSKFSGKYDFYDEIAIFGLDKILNSKVYIKNLKNPLKLTCLKDCVPYYPYIVSMSSFSKENDKNIIILSTKSYVDIEEEKTLNFYFNQIKKEYQKCKRNNIEFDVDNVYKKICYNSIISQIDFEEIIKRFIEKGNKTNFKGIHLNFFNLYRDCLTKEMEKFYEKKLKQ